MYESNYDVLAKVVEEDAVVRNVSKHRLPDGTFDLEGNMKIWNDAIARFDQIQLWENGAPNFNQEETPLQPQPSIIFVPAHDTDEIRGTIIVACGGGFTSRTGCEGMNVAWYFVNNGFNVAILTYRLMPYSRLDAMDDMQRAIRLLRFRKDELKISEKVVCMGFSAGGMLSGNCATHFDPKADPADEIDKVDCRPDAACVCYGAFAPLSFPTAFGMRRNGPSMFGRNFDEQVYLALELNVTPQTCPMFIWQTNSDDPRNAMALANALAARKIPFELHCYTDGVHGLAMADGHNDLAMNVPQVQSWAPLCAQWLKDRGI